MSHDGKIMCEGRKNTKMARTKMTFPWSGLTLDRMLAFSDRSTQQGWSFSDFSTKAHSSSRVLCVDWANAVPKPQKHHATSWKKKHGKFRYAHSSSKAAGSFSIFLTLSRINSRMLALGQAIWPKFQPSDTIGMGIARIAHPPPRHWKNHQCEDQHTGDEAKEEVIVSLPYTSPLFSERLKYQARIGSSKMWVFWCRPKTDGLNNSASLQM